MPSESRDKGTKAILASVEFHHFPILHSDGGSNEPTNLVPMNKAAHAHETRTVTIPTIAKGKRIRSAEQKHEAAMAKKIGLVPDAGTVRPAWVSDAYSGTRSHAVKKKIPSRPFAGSRKFNGQVKWRSDKKE